MGSASPRSLLALVGLGALAGCDLFHGTSWPTRCEAEPAAAACAASGGDGTGAAASSSSSGAQSGGAGAVGSGGGSTASTGGAGGVDGHVTDGLLVLYTFDDNGGAVVSDTSGEGAPLDLTVADPAAVEWIAGGVRIALPTLIASEGPATKVIEGCQATSEITLEVWFVPATLTQAGPARLITNSVNTSSRNFQLGQQAALYYQARLRSTSSDDNGFPIVETPADGGDVQVALTHLLYTRDAAGNRHLYVNGVERGANILLGDFSNWDPSYRLAMANEFTLDRTWLGELHRTAIYQRALTPDEVAQNFAAGP